MIEASIAWPRTWQSLGRIASWLRRSGRHVAYYQFQLRHARGRTPRAVPEAATCPWRVFRAAPGSLPWPNRPGLSMTASKARGAVGLAALISSAPRQKLPPHAAFVRDHI